MQSFVGTVKLHIVEIIPQIRVFILAILILCYTFGNAENMSQMAPCPSIFHRVLRVYHTRHLWDPLKSDESRQIPPRRVSLEDRIASNDFIGSSPQGSSVRGKLMERERSRARETEGGREREEGSVQKNERKRSLYARVCLVVTRGASIQPVARLAHSFLHSYTLHAI